MDNSPHSVNLSADLAHLPTRDRALVMKAAISGAIGPTQEALLRAACAVVPKSGQCAATGGRFCVYSLLMQERYCTVSPRHTCGKGECLTDRLIFEVDD